MKKYIFVLNDKCFVIQKIGERWTVEVTDNANITPRYAGMLLRSISAFCFAAR